MLCDGTALEGKQDEGREAGEVEERYEGRGEQ
jgi:hypothetical protein